MTTEPKQGDMAFKVKYINASQAAKLLAAALNQYLMAGDKEARRKASVVAKAALSRYYGTVE